MNEKKANIYLSLYLSEQIDEKTWTELLIKHNNLRKKYEQYLIQRRIRNADKKDKFI